MSSLPLQIVLPFAVACSQIFGGVSCCCLSGVLSVGWSSWSETSSKTGREVSTASHPITSKCPKCEASRASNASGKSESKGGRPCTISDDNQCRCAKVAASAGLNTEPVSLNNVPHELAPMANAWSVVPAAEAGLTRIYDVPVRCGGRSWQSVACVWKN